MEIWNFHEHLVLTNKPHDFYIFSIVYLLAKLLFTSQVLVNLLKLNFLSRYSLSNQCKLAINLADVEFHRAPTLIHDRFKIFHHTIEDGLNLFKTPKAFP